jgi:hypothetical protein
MKMSPEIVVEKIRVSRIRPSKDETDDSMKEMPRHGIGTDSKKGSVSAVFEAL